MASNQNNVWFPAKKYGWGWRAPYRWQGWLVYLVWLGLLVTGGVVLAPRSIALYIAWALVLGVLLFAVVLMKGEKPRWRWGEDEHPQARSATERLTALDELHRQRRISDEEYQTKRQQILREL
jgi:uncharacterized membrane protein